MKKILLLFLLLPHFLNAQKFSQDEIARWEKQAQQVTIIRDNWGIPHIYGKKDADAVFGLLYAQCEDDFRRVEMNYIEKLGRMSEVKGESEIYEDLLIRMVLDSTDAVKDFEKSPAWLKELLYSFADGINYYLYKHPEVKPLLLKRFEPWYPLLWTDGSIGAISTAELETEDLKKFYTGEGGTGSNKEIAGQEVVTGSNGFAFSPSITKSGKSILYINPHVTFYFRPEVHMVSEEGLNVYGAVTWGQFFIYQGFNEKCGWMHTSCYTDISDIYLEKVSKQNEQWVYEYEGKKLPVSEREVKIYYASQEEKKVKEFTVYATHHGPIMAKNEAHWMSMKASNRSLTGLIQSWERTKSKSFEDYKKGMGLLSNTSNSTVYADAEGNIAYWHGNFLPIRDPAFDWSKPVDGSIAATEWKGLHTVEESVHIYNPNNGWIQNCNSTPFTVAGTNSPKKENYPVYMAPDGENFRGINAVKVLGRQTDYDIDKVIKAGYDMNLAAFEVLVPALIRTFDKNISPSDSLYGLLKEPINVLRNWDYHCGTKSIATTLAIEWGQKLFPEIMKTAVSGNKKPDQVDKTREFAEKASSTDLLLPFSKVIRELNTKFGKWQVSWGEINRFQRNSADISQQYDDAKPSIPVPFASSLWGMLPSYTSRYFQNTKLRYGVNGNSFICAVEFGEKIRAKSLLAGGESGNPDSAHFDDQLEMYAKGKFKDVLFYKEDILKHAEKTYHPGE